MEKSINPNQKEFSQAVYDIVRLIPKGRITSYGAIAKALGSARSSRLVGYCMNYSHNEQIPVPAHRVVNRNGLLSGRAHFNPPSKMQELLEKEGLVIKDHQIENFEAYFWDPIQEIQV